MAYVCLVIISDAKIVNNQAEHNVVYGVPPKDLSVGDRFVSKFIEMVDQLVMGQTASLWESVHVLAYFDKNVSVFFQVVEVVLVDDVIGYEVKGNEHDLASFHVGAKVNFFDINCHEFAVLLQNCTVENKIVCGECSSGRADAAWIINFVPAAGKADMISFGLVWAFASNKGCVRWLASLWNFGRAHEENGVLCCPFCSLEQDNQTCYRRP